MKKKFVKWKKDEFCREKKTSAAFVVQCQHSTFAFTSGTAQRKRIKSSSDRVRRTDFAQKLTRRQPSLDQHSGSGRDAEIAANANILHSPSQLAQPNTSE